MTEPTLVLPEAGHRRAATVEERGIEVLTVRQLMWLRFKRNRPAIVSAVVLSRMLPEPEGIGVLVAVVLGQALLGMASAWAGRAHPAQAP